MSDEIEKIVALKPASVLGVVSGAPDLGAPDQDRPKSTVKLQPMVAVDSEKPSPTAKAGEILSENVKLVQTYCAALGQTALRADLQEALQTTDPGAVTDARDVTPEAVQAALEKADLQVSDHRKVKLKRAPMPALAVMDTGQFVMVHRVEAGVVVTTIPTRPTAKQKYRWLNSKAIFLGAP